MVDKNFYGVDIEKEKTQKTDRCNLFFYYKKY